MLILSPMDPRVVEDSKFYEKYFTSQVGGGALDHFFRVYDPSNDQSGDGIGSFLAGLWNMIKPAVFSAGKAVGNQVLTSGASYLSDLTSGANVKKAAQMRLSEMRESLKQKADDKIKLMSGGGGGGGKKRKRKTTHSGSSTAKRQKVKHHRHHHTPSRRPTRDLRLRPPRKRSLELLF